MPTSKPKKTVAEKPSAKRATTPKTSTKASAKPGAESSAVATEKKIPILSRLRPAEGAVRDKKRVGRGVGSGLGKTAGRGQKGQKARSTGRIGKLHFEGGQVPLQRRLPKVGFFNPFAREVSVVNLRDLNRFDASSEVGIDALVKTGLVKTKHAAKGEIKVLAKGEIEKALTVRAHAFSAEAKRKIEAAGGKAVVLESKKQRRIEAA